VLCALLLFPIYIVVLALSRTVRSATFSQLQSPALIFELTGLCWIGLTALFSYAVCWRTHL